MHTRTHARARAHTHTRTHTHAHTHIKIEEIEASVAKLIMSGQISARIDSENKTLHVKQTEMRAATFRKVLSVCVCVFICL